MTLDVLSHSHVRFVTNFDKHMNNHNETSYEELTQISNASESLWRYVPCISCGEKYENELDLKIHQDTDHTEEMKCQECSYKRKRKRRKNISAQAD